jgi:hypothetical protein
MDEYLENRSPSKKNNHKSHKLVDALILKHFIKYCPEKNGIVETFLYSFVPS